MFETMRLALLFFVLGILLIVANFDSSTFVQTFKIFNLLSVSPAGGVLEREDSKAASPCVVCFMIEI